MPRKIIINRKANAEREERISLSFVDSLKFSDNVEKDNLQFRIDQLSRLMYEAMEVYDKLSEYERNNLREAVLEASEPVFSYMTGNQ